PNNSSVLPLYSNANVFDRWHPLLSYLQPQAARCGQFGVRTRGFTNNFHMNGYHLDNRQITEVWADNLEEEFERIRDVVEQYQYVAMDTEFPGIVARPVGHIEEYYYQTVKCNVDLLKVIQLGITFADARGNLAHGTSTWQFNFRFDLKFVLIILHIIFIAFI
ncbi:ccr4-associated factor family protein, partial [Cardiosporidium cionae]